MKSWIIPLLVLSLFGFVARISAAEDNGKRPPKPSLEKLTAEEREARLKEWRKTNGPNMREELERRREQFKKLTPEEREAKRKELKERLEKRISELKEKKAKSALTVPETRELERREQILKRFEQEAAAKGEPGGAPPSKGPAQ